MQIHDKNCNCFDCIWERICLNQGRTITLFKGKKVSYLISGKTIIWVAIEASQNILFKQNIKSIYKSIVARNNNASPSEYPGTAASYKWALLNDSRIWFS